jgi:class 3 adenylate cyclase
MSMTTENVALLFTDVVGSTALSQSLGPEAGDQVRRDHFAILRQSLADAGGIEVKNLGDGLMAVFSSASAALACGVAMQQAVDRDNRGRQHAVGLRVGLSGGEVVHEDGDYFGDPVIEAARLCAICNPGQILVADVVRLMAGRRSLLDFRSLGDLTLKGLMDPVQTVELLWEPAAAPRSIVPLPRRLAVRPVATVSVVGRESELSSLADAAKRVAAGDGREVVLVSGEAGQGKTTLVAEAARLAFDNGSCVLFGHCEEDLATPYQLFAEAFGHYVAHADEERLQSLVAAHGSEWARLVPALDGRIPALPPSKATDPDSERYLLFTAAVGLLTAMSQDDPVVLVLDDLQWADSGSLALLRHLTATDPLTRVLVLGTFRDSEVSRSPDLRDTLGTLWRHQGVSRLELGGLDIAGVVSLMEATAGYALDGAAVSLAHALLGETDGNPFFVTEVLRHLRDTGAIHRNQAGRWVTDGTVDRTALPESVREVIGGRVVRLGPDAGRVLSTAAVIGRDFDLDVLGRATRIAADALLDILEAATTISLVQEVDDAPGRYIFDHALFQHTLYEGLGPTRRALTHERVALALEESCGGHPGTRVGELARHWVNATPPANLPSAIRYSREAADAALDSLAPGDALRYYTQALELYDRADDPDVRLGIDLRIGLGTSQRQTGDPCFRSTLLTAAGQAARTGDVDRLVAAALANDRGFYSAVGATDKEKVDTLETALDLLPATHPGRALVLATLCSELAHGSPLDRRQALAEEAVAIAESSGDDAVIVRVLNHLHVPLQVPPMLELTSPGPRRAWCGPSGSTTPCCCSGLPSGAPNRRPEPATSTRWTAVSPSTAQWSSGSTNQSSPGATHSCVRCGHRSQGTRIWPSSTRPRRSGSAPKGGSLTQPASSVRSSTSSADSGVPRASSLRSSRRWPRRPRTSLARSSCPSWPRPTSKEAASTRLRNCSMSSRPLGSSCRSTRSGSLGWSTSPRPPSSAGTRPTPAPCSSSSSPGPDSCPPPAHRPSARSATISVASPPSSATSTRRTPILPDPPR